MQSKRRYQFFLRVEPRFEMLGDHGLHYSKFFYVLHCLVINLLIQLYAHIRGSYTFCNASLIPSMFMFLKENINTP